MQPGVPLADKMRPHTIDDVIGQAHLLNKGEILREIIKNKRPVSLILWGPPGSGKTTLARIIAKETGADFIEISAVTASKADVTKVVERARANLRASGFDGVREDGEQQTKLYMEYSAGAAQPATKQSAKSTSKLGGSADQSAREPRRTVLFVDEIHRFNKAQQDAFLPHVESGLITLIGATTENPSFEVITPLLSRSRVLVLQPHSKADIVKILKRAVSELKVSKRVDAKALDYLAELSGGDARVALGNLELALQLTNGKVTVEAVKTAAQRRLPGYDKQGEYHYNLISAFIKSMRGSAPDATLYYLARMLDAGEDPKFIARRMVIFASEDIGLAAPAALNQAVSTFQAVERIGMPECSYNLYQCALVMAKSPKSRTVANAMFAANKAAKDYPDAPVPLHLRNAPTKLMKDLGYQKDYQWKANFKHKDGFLPKELKNTKIVED